MVDVAIGSPVEHHSPPADVPQHRGRNQARGAYKPETGFTDEQL